MESVKEQARRLVENLPDDAGWDRLLYEVYMRQRIADGIRAADEGRVTDHDEVKRRFAARRGG